MTDPASDCHTESSATGNAGGGPVRAPETRMLRA